ncbi:hypothetical protein DNTS_031838 [Danionella cerebrum]|uniref:Glycosyltransferase family 92 protein n=1 Tax=Danionella cerebrum TaxID=2873325 RepID=A0A553QH75_9TELE|nr:hypothetical protein DNTS_031838 [Danionella translucida]
MTKKCGLLKNDSEAALLNNRICVLKVFYIIGISSVFACIIFIYYQDNLKVENAIWESGSYFSSHPKSTHLLPFKTQNDFHAPSTDLSSEACGLPVKDDTVIKLNNQHTYVIGSYMEHRYIEKEIKTIAIVLRSEEVNYVCVMCCQGENVTSQAEYVIHRDHFEFDYGTATISCPIESSCLNPTHVALTTSDLSSTIDSFQPIRNREPPSVFPVNFTICISTMYDYKDVLNLVESMEMFRILGAQKVAIYRTNCNPDVQKILDYYVKQNFVDIIPWTISDHIEVSSGWRKAESQGQLHYYGQIPALNDCVYRYMYQSRYLALQDMDEVILPFADKTWTSLLPKLEEFYGDSVGFEFENNIFPFKQRACREYDISKWKHVKGTNILNYIHRLPNVPNEFNNYKIIVNPRLVVKPTVHGILEGIYDDSLTVRVHPNVARMYHWKPFGFPSDTQLILDDHLWDYANDLVPAVSRVLQECGFFDR